MKYFVDNFKDVAFELDPAALERSKNNFDILCPLPGHKSSSNPNFFLEIANDGINFKCGCRTNPDCQKDYNRSARTCVGSTVEETLRYYWFPEKVNYYNHDEYYSRGVKLIPLAWERKVIPLKGEFKITKDGKVYRKRISFREPDYQFPFYNKDGRIVYFRYRYKEDPTGRGDNKYTCPAYWKITSNWYITGQRFAPKEGFEQSIFIANVIDRPAHERKVDRKVILCEGEKSAQAMQQFIGDEYVCISGANGAASMRKLPVKLLNGFPVTIWPDNDKMGFEAAHQTFNELLNNGINVNVVDLSSFRDKLPEKWDVADELPEGLKINFLDLIKTASKPTSARLDTTCASILLSGSEARDANENCKEEVDLWKNHFVKFLGFSAKPDVLEACFSHKVTGGIISIKLEELPAKMASFGSDSAWKYLFKLRGIKESEYCDQKKHQASDTDYYKFSRLKSIEVLKLELNKIAMDYDMPLYNPDTDRRGVGAWREYVRDPAGFPKEKIIYNTGNEIISKGEKPIDVRKYNSRHHYSRSGLINTFGKEASLEERKFWYETLGEVWNFPESFHRDIVYGWGLAAPFGGLYDWRPHISMISEPKSGKSTLKKILGKIAGEHHISVSGLPTEAGIRQKFPGSSTPIFLDEFRSSSTKDEGRLQSIVALMRSSSSPDAYILRGTASQTAMSFKLSSMFMVLSNTSHIRRQEDQSRFIEINLRPLRKEKVWKEDKLKKTFDSYFGERMRSYIWNNIHRILKVISYLEEKFMDEVDPRQAKSMALCLGTTWSCLHESGVPSKIESYLVNIKDFYRNVEEDVSRDADKFFGLILGENLSHRDQYNTETKSVFDWACEAKWANESQDTCLLDRIQKIFALNKMKFIAEKFSKKYYLYIPGGFLGDKILNGVTAINLIRELKKSDAAVQDPKKEGLSTSVRIAGTVTKGVYMKLDHLSLD